MEDLLRVNLTTKEVFRQKCEYDPLVAGRALVDFIMTDEGVPTCHPLSSENILIISPGFIAGTAVPTSGRLSVGGKSPLTGGIKEANVGGSIGQKLARLGIRGIVVTGQADEWLILKIDADGEELIPAAEYAGLGNYELCRRLQDQYGEKVGIASIGPCGEACMSASSVAVTDADGKPSRHAARGGMGAVMGSKKLKAVIADETGTSVRQGKDAEVFKNRVKDVAKMLKNSPLCQFLHAQGTPAFVDMDQARGSLPTNNHRAGSFDKFTEINATKLLELQSQRGGKMGKGCMPGCAVACSSIYNGPKGEYVTSGLEYETLVMLGANIGVSDIDQIARMDGLCDDYGVDTIEMGVTMGVLSDTPHYNLGDGARAIELIKEIGKGTILGRILGQGAAVTARVFGISRVPVVKGQGIPAHSARSIKGLGVTYAVSPQGADHTAGFVTEEPLSNAGHAKRSLDAQLDSAFLDASGFCYFTFLTGNWKVFGELANALYGKSYSVDDMRNFAAEILKRERAFNLAAGFGPGADRLPDFMKREELPPTQAVFDVPDEDLDNVFNF